VIAMTGSSHKSGAIGRTISIVERAVGNDIRALAVNLDESPLATLMRRKDKNGACYLTLAEFNAGERLRTDFTLGCLMQRVSANWSAAVSGGRRGAHDSTANLTETALSARMRLQKALSAVGPELSGVLADVCCYLKGIETVELERQWPARSAKVMLKAALGALARHYNPPVRQQSIRQWGAEDFRPSISQ
jgi:Domain of unknown function (DUF6456)